MKLYGFLFALAFALTFTGCATSYSIVGDDGSTVQGSMLNGAASYSSGDGCAPATPSPLTPPPATPAPLTVKRICDGLNCVNMMVAETAPTCTTQVVNVRGNDISSYFSWVFAALGAAALAVASGT